MADSGLFNMIYNPDVLTCLANLSNDEVFTPPEVANQMLDLLPQELFRNPDTRFLDPACKSGVFLREIAKRLLAGLERQIPDLQERVDHIFHHQLYGIAITELTSLLSRRSVYCSKYANSRYSVTSFDTPDGNVRYKRKQHTWQNGKCIYCGASQGEYERSDDLETHAYEFIHWVKPEEIFGMKFDVIIGNPPYQLNTSGAGKQAKPIYQHFVRQAKKLNPRYLVMITPSRWMAGGMGLDDYRDEMLNNNHIRSIVDYSLSTDCFPGVDIAGGVSYFIIDSSYKGDCSYTYIDNGVSTERNRKLNEYPVFVRNNMAIDIVKKVSMLGEESISSIMTSLGVFGLGIEAVREFRQTSKRGATRKLASTPYLFGEIRQPTKGMYLIVPLTSSQNRRYIPIGFESCEVITTSLVQMLPGAGLYEFGVLTSNVDNAWMRAVCGRLKSDYRYTITNVYNNFPWPDPTEAQRARIEQTAQAILDARALYPEASLADLYDELTMPPELRKAHQANDKAVMEAYGMPIKETTESSCVAELMRRYQAMTASETKK